MGDRTEIYRGERVDSFKETFGDWKPGVFYSVHFGDAGYEWDPGVEAEPLAVVIAEVKTAIRELQELLRVLENAETQALQGLPAGEQETGAEAGPPLCDSRSRGEEAA